MLPLYLCPLCIVHVQAWSTGGGGGNPVTRVSNGSGAVQIWYSREFGLLPVTHQWHVPTTVLWWVTGARWVSGATCCSRFHPLGACDFDTNGWWVSGATIFPSEETLKFHFLSPGGSFFQPFRLFKIYRIHRPPICLWTQQKHAPMIAL